MVAELELAIKRLQQQGYNVKKATGAYVSADGYILTYTVGGGLASNDDIIRIASGLDHLQTGPDFELGQAVQLLMPLLPPANVPVGAVATVEAISPGEITIRKGNKVIRVERSSVKAFPVPEAQKPRS